MKQNPPFFGVMLILILTFISACREDNQQHSIVFERGRLPDYCVPLRTSEGDEVFNSFKKFILARRKNLGGDQQVWRIYGPLKCGNQVSFFANKDLEIKDGSVSLEAGSHFTVNYNEETKGFEVIGGM